MVAAETAQARLAELLHFGMKRFPDGEQREEVGVGVNETAMRGVGLRLFFERAFARILHAEAGGDDEHLADRLLGARLDAWFGLTIPFTTGAVVIAEAFVALPFLVLSVDGSLRSADRRFEQAAAALGASRWYVFRRVTLPLVGPSVIAGGVLCFARALGEFGATITFAGNFPGTTQTMPLAIYLAMERDPDVALALSLVLIAVSLAVLVGLRSRWLAGLVGVQQ